jgi:hypothetical protein
MRIKVFVILVLIVNVFVVNADAFSEIGGSIVLRALDEVTEFIQKVGQRYFESANLGKISGYYTWCRNLSQILADRTADKSTRTFWLNRVNECTKMIDIIREIHLTEASRSNNSQRYQDIFFQSAEEIGDTLMKEFYERLGIPFP